MGKASNGILGAVRGKVNNLVFYSLNGQDIVRTIGNNKKSVASVARKAQNDSMALLMRFFSKTKPFIKAGFKNEAIGTIYNYHNLATSYNKVHAINIVENVPQIDYTRILLSRGKALMPKDPILNKTGDGLSISWTVEKDLPWTTNQDQTMLLAYFPEVNEAIFDLAGAKRRDGTAQLTLPPAFRELELETYLAFVSEDRESVSNSMHLK
jgi:hypothetical protein